MRKCIFLMLFVTLSACSPFVTSTPPDPPEPLLVSYTPTLKPWAIALHQCALDQPEIALITEETSSPDLEFVDGVLVLSFGVPAQGISGYAAQIGTDEIVIIAGSEVALRNLNANQLRELYMEPKTQNQIWTYTQGNELRAIFDHTIFGDATSSSNAMLAPDPEAMMEAVEADPMAIGYLPGSWLSGKIQKISIDQDLQRAFEHPILALTETEPIGNLEQFLFCLQRGENP